jgi:probable phosphoglycerate mutase
MPKKIIIFRHGETDHNKSKIIQGWTDAALNSTGLNQAKKLAQRLEGVVVDVFYTSDLKRANQTAAEVAKKLKIKPIKTKKIRERNFGIFENKTWDSFKDINRKDIINGLYGSDKDWKKHHGESRNDVAIRVKDFINNLTKIHQDQIVLISTHGGTKRELLHHFGIKNNQEFYSLENTSVSILEKDSQGKYKLSLFNDTTHLEK